MPLSPTPTDAFTRLAPLPGPPPARSTGLDIAPPPLPALASGLARFQRDHDPMARIAATEPAIPPLTAAEIRRFTQLGSQTPAMVKALSHNTLATPESLPQRLAMFVRVLDATAGTPQQSQLLSLLANRKLTDTQGDDRHSTLFHLYGILTTPRADGLNARTTLAETIQFLANPDGNEQNFTHLTPRI